MSFGRITPSLFATFALGLAHFTSAQYFFKHVPLGTGITLYPGEAGGVRVVTSAYMEAGELVLDAAGTITSSTLMDQPTEDHVFLRELLPYGEGGRLAFGTMDVAPGVATVGSILLARVPDGATTAEAVLIGTAEQREFSTDIHVFPGGQGAVVLGRAPFGPNTDLRYKLVVGQFDPALQPAWLQAVDVLEKNMFPVRLFVDPTNGEITCMSLNYSPGADDYSASLVRLASTGDLLWAQTIDHAVTGYENGDLVRDAGGDFYLAHQLADQTTFQFVLSRISSAGTVLWSKLVSAPGTANFDRLYLHNGALYAVCTTGVLATAQYVLLMKMDLEGQVLWSHTYGATDRTNDATTLLVAPDADGAEAIWVTGTYRLNGASPQNVFVLKVDGEGEADGLVCPGPDFTFTTAATTVATTAGGTVLAYDAVGSASVRVGTQPQQTISTECLPNAIAEEASVPLLSVAPVPTRGPCTVTFADEHGALQLRVLDALGRCVLEQRVAAHTQNVHLDLSELRSGTYLLVVDDAAGVHHAVRVVKE